jgi:hypothetical protein
MGIIGKDNLKMRNVLPDAGMMARVLVEWGNRSIGKSPRGVGMWQNVNPLQFFVDDCESD